MSLHGVTRVRIPRLIDIHMHLRQLPFMAWVIAQLLDVYDWVLPIGNTTPPIATGPEALDYELKILAAGARFRVIKSLFFTEELTVELIEQAWQLGVKSIKLMFKQTSVGSQHGIPFDALWDYRRHFALMEKLGLVLQIHAEHPGVENLLERERACLPYVRQLATEFPQLKIVIEHATTIGAINLAYELENVWCSITLHHLVLLHWMVLGNHDHLCLPVAKDWQDREELLRAAFSTHPRFVFGSDSAPHPRTAKDRAKGACGIFSAPTTALLIQIAEERGALDRLEDFTSKRAAQLFQLEPSGETVEFVREPQDIPFETDPSHARPFLAGRRLDWRLAA